MSHDEKSQSAPRRYLIDVEETIRLVLEQEDTDGDFQISITDAGPKILSLGTATSNGFKTFDIRVRSIMIPSLLPTDAVFVKGHLHVVEPPSRTCSGS